MIVYFKPGILDEVRLGEVLEFIQIRPDNPPIFEVEVKSLTSQVLRDRQSCMDVPKRICFCCDGGLNRSVMAANILNHIAQKRRLLVKGAARAAYRNTQGQQISSRVWETLENH